MAKNIDVQRGDVVKIGTHRYVVVESHGGTYADDMNGFGAQRIQPQRGYDLEINGRVHKVNEMYRLLSVREVESVNRDGKIIYRKKEGN